MNMYFRFIWLLIKRFVFLKKQDVFSVCRTQFIVNPLDLDINLHMNNGRYLTLMDLGRLDLLMKANAFWKLFLNGYYPVVAAEGIRFKKSLDPFQKFYLLTELQAWDEKDFYITQKFEYKNKIVAEGVIKGRFKKRGRKGSVPTEEIFKILGQQYTGPNLNLTSQALHQLQGCLVVDEQTTENKRKDFK